MITTIQLIKLKYLLIKWINTTQIFDKILKSCEQITF